MSNAADIIAAIRLVNSVIIEGQRLSELLARTDLTEEEVIARVRANIARMEQLRDEDPGTL